MDLTEYFAQHNGTAVLSTADSEGRVNAAIYSKPHILEGDGIALLMADRLSHANLQENPNAVYLFIQEGPGWQGIRIYLKKIREERNTELARSLIRRKDTDIGSVEIYLVYFQVEKILPLIGD